MTIFESYVDPNSPTTPGDGSAAYPYRNLSIWENAAEHFTATAGDTVRAICRRNGSAKDTAGLYIIGWSSGVKIEVVADPAYRHNGTPDSGYVIEPAAGLLGFRVSTDVNVLSDGLEMSNLNGSYGYYRTGGSLTVNNGLIYNLGTKSTVSNATAATTTLNNCMVFDIGSAENIVYNCTANNTTVYVKSGQGTAAGLFFRGSVCTNCAVFVEDVASRTYPGYFACTGDYNVDSSGSAATQFTNYAINKTSYSSYFNNIAGNDFHLNDSSYNLWGLNSANLTSTFTTDFEGDTRPDSNQFGIGPDFYVASGGSQALTGSAAAASTANGVISVNLALIGSSVSTSSSTGAVALDVSLNAAATAVSTATGQASIVLALTGSSGALSSAIATLDTVSDIPLSGSSTAISTAVGTLSASIGLTGTAATVSSAGGSVAVAVALLGSVGATSAAGSDLTIEASGITALAGESIATGTVVGSLGLTREISGTTIATTSANSQMVIAVALIGSASAISIVQGMINTGEQIKITTESRVFILDTAPRVFTLDTAHCVFVLDNERRIFKI